MEILLAILSNFLIYLKLKYPPDPHTKHFFEYKIMPHTSRSAKHCFTFRHNSNQRPHTLCRATCLPAKGLALIQALLCHWRALTEQNKLKPADSHQWPLIAAMILRGCSCWLRTYCEGKEKGCTRKM